MERGFFQAVQRALRPLRRARGRGQRFADADIVLVALWAALHDRPVSWACRRENWPTARHRRRLPDQSTMSRRLRTRPVLALIELLLAAAAHVGAAPSRCAALDGRAMVVSRYTGDRHALKGWGRGRFELGYKLHALVDAHTGRLLEHLVAPLNVAESVAARVLLRRAVAKGLLAKDAVVLADANYDSNKLHRCAASLRLRLIAPRRVRGQGLGRNAPGGHHPSRLLSLLATEHCPTLAAALVRRRGTVERTFARQVCTGLGLRDLPPWARTIQRVRAWVALKLLLHALNAAVNTPAPLEVVA
jgi:hypothetical protein